MTDRQTMVSDIKSRLDEWNAQIDKLESEMKEASEDAKATYEAKLSELRQLRDRGEARLREMQEENESSWEQRQAEARRAWQDIKDGFQRALERVS